MSGDTGIEECIKLVEAVRLRRPSRLEELLASGSLQDEDGRQEAALALKQAAQDGYLDAARLLLDAGVSPGVADIELIEIPLTGAASHGHYDMLKLLLEYDAEVNQRNSYGSTALHKAVLNRYMDCISLLLDYGADCNVPDAAGDTAIIVASGLNDSKPLATLLRRGGTLNLDHKNNQYRSALQTAVERNSIDIVKLLLGMGADPNSADGDYRTCLHMASLRGHHEILELLLKMGGNPNIEDRIHHTPIFEAAWQGHYQCVDKLIKAGAKVDTVDRRDYFALALASLNGHIQSVDMILDAGCDINLQGYLKNTALHDAAWNGWYITVTQLLKRGANPNLQDLRGATPLFKSMLKKDLKRKDFKTWKALVRYNTNLEIKGKAVNEHICEGTQMTAFQLALQIGHVPAAKILLVAGTSRRAVQRWFLNNRIPRKLQQDPAHCNYIRHVCFTPMPLTQLCRVMLRKCLGLKILDKVKQLPIPKSVQHFITLAELEEMEFNKFNDIYPIPGLAVDIFQDM